jgi:hypothetical protein
MEQLADVGLGVAERGAGLFDGEDSLSCCRERAQQERFLLAQRS